METLEPLNLIGFENKIFLQVSNTESAYYRVAVINKNVNFGSV